MGWFGKKELTKVTTEKAQIRTILSKVSESGSIQPTIDVPVAPDVSGEVVGLFVKEGQQVNRGQLLVTIRPDNYKAAMEQSEASLNLAKSDHLQAQANVRQLRTVLSQDSVSLERTRNLFREGVISKVEMEASELKFNTTKSQIDAALFSVQAAFFRIKSAEASLKQAKQNLNQTNVYASMDGTVTKLNVELGQRVVGTMQMQGTEMIKIADLSKMEVVVEISENDIVNISLGDSTAIEVDAFPKQKFYGKVSDISYSASTAGLGTTDQVTNFQVKVQITPDSYQALNEQRKIAANRSPFRPGMSALVEIFTDKKENIVTVPIQAVTLKRDPAASENKGTFAKSEQETPKPTTSPTQKKEEVAFVFDGGKAKEIIVSTGISDDSYIEILTGLKEGDNVITGPYTVVSKKLTDGMEIALEGEEKGNAKKEKAKKGE